MQSCAEPIPTTPVTCGGEVCTAPMYANNPCVVPCCISVGGQERCGAKSTAAMLITECAAPVAEDPSCPAADDGMGSSLPGCCNAGLKQCGIISSLRPGCITESQFITLPDPPIACTPGGDGDAGIDDAGIDPDAG